MSATQDILTKRFGHKHLFPIQQEIIDHVLRGRHALVVMPTGSGKSLCYQLPALAMDRAGITVVFSPLIALMEDQVAALKRKGIRAGYINSTLDRAKREQRYQALARGEFDLIYATPERMHKADFRAALDKVPGGIKLLAIDEAHCVTKWGHDFRPAYQQVGQFRTMMGAPVTVALTATATAEVRRDIVDTLGLTSEEMPLFATGIDRPNLSFAIKGVWGDQEKRRAILDTAREQGGTGIVYFSLIKHLEEFEPVLRREYPGVLGIYHRKLSPSEKKRTYDRFINADPEDGLMLLATNAFGMGVDKPDIRYIVHAQVPGSVEAYYQEVGRAGRDGKPSNCTLLYNEDDLAIQQQFIEWMNPSPTLMIQASTALEHLGDADFDVDELRDLIIHKNRGDRRAEYCLIALEKMGCVEASSGPGRYRFVRALRDEELAPQEMANKKQRDLRRLLDVVNLTKSNDIRNYIEHYFEL